MYLPWVLTPAAISKIENRRSRETGGSELYQSTNRWRRLDGLAGCARCAAAFLFDCVNEVAKPPATCRAAKSSRISRPD